MEGADLQAPLRARFGLICSLLLLGRARDALHRPERGQALTSPQACWRDSRGRTFGHYTITGPDVPEAEKRPLFNTPARSETTGALALEGSAATFSDDRPARPGSGAPASPTSCR